MQCIKSVYKKSDTMGSRVIKITSQTFNRSPMVFRRHMHELREFVHGSGNIQQSHPEMLEAIDHLTVHGGIDRCGTIISSQGSTNDKRCGDRFEVEHAMFAQKINDILLLRWEKAQGGSQNLNSTEVT